MSRLSRAAHGAALTVERAYDTGLFRLKQRMGWIRPIAIVPYLGYGTEEGVHVKGRVLEDRGIAPAGAHDTVWDNLRMSYRRFQSNEIPGVPVQLRFGGAEEVVTTDHEGYFEAHLRPEGYDPAGRLWHDVQLEIREEVVAGQGPVRCTGRVQLPPGDADFGVISDVDDTVLRTGATDFLKMMRVTLLNNAHTRVPFEGVAAFYRALQQGTGRHARNPIFYVSSSPWNLYDLLVDFFAVHNLPAGTLLLRDLGLEPGRFIKSSHGAHKLAQICRVFETYPHLSFLLIGDSGQHDPEIYHQVVRDYPGRVAAIYIREVTSGAREAEVNAVAEQVRQLGTEMLLVRKTDAAARHAAERGFISRPMQREVETRSVPNAVSVEDVQADREPAGGR